MRGFELRLREVIYPWRIMSLVFAGVLVVSIGVQKLASPVTDAVIRDIDRAEITVTGTIADSRAVGEVPNRPAEGDPPLYVLVDNRALYRLNDAAHAAVFAGQRVRISGILHTSSGILEVKAISVIN
jgi:hypothetical protein